MVPGDADADGGPGEASDERRGRAVLGDLLDLGDRPDGGVHAVELWEEQQLATGVVGGGEGSSRNVGFNGHGDHHVGEHDAVA